MKPLLSEFLQTYYISIELNIKLTINEFSFELNSFMVKNNFKNYSFITANNPLAIKLNYYNNIYNNNLLLNYLYNYIYYNMYGISFDYNHIEYGYIIFNIHYYDAINIAKYFNQLAILYGQINNTPKLIYV